MADYKTIIDNWRLKGYSDGEDTSDILYEFSRVFSYNSSKLDNPEVTEKFVREIFDTDRITGFTGCTSTVFDMQDQKSAFRWLTDRVQRKTKLSGKFIRFLQGIICNGSYSNELYDAGERPGQFKRGNYAGADNAGLPFDEVESEISFLCNQVNEALEDISKPDNIIKTAAYFYCNFEYIHAFADGNGRTGRAMLDYILMLGGCPPIVIFDEL